LLLLFQVHLDAAPFKASGGDQHIPTTSSSSSSYGFIDFDLASQLVPFHVISAPTLFGLYYKNNNFP
jgi:hypothetical protein